MPNPTAPRIPIPAIRLGTRGSPLALWQADHVSDRLRRAFPGLQVEVVVIRTAAEKFPDRPVPAIGVGIFTKEIDEEMLAGRIDLAVHSMKDVPSEIPREILIAAVPQREDPLDAFIGTSGPGGPALWDLPRGSAIGTGSPRRKAQLLHRRPDLMFVPLRGNVDTRLRKSREQGLAGTILARAGLRRLGKESLILHAIPLEWIIPAVGQGALAISALAGRRDILEILGVLDHAPTHIRIDAERAFLAQLRGGCQVPAGALAEVTGENGQPKALRIQGVVAAPDGSQCIRGEITGLAEEAGALGRKLADELMVRGGKEILETLRSVSGPGDPAP